MERELLRKVQLTQLEIAKEIRRVCEENDIPYLADKLLQLTKSDYEMIEMLVNYRLNHKE